jgi:hypothetical protein
MVKNKYFQLALLVLLILFYSFYDDIKSPLAVQLQKNSLPHYKNATRIDKQKFESITSEVGIAPDTRYRWQDKVKNMFYIHPYDGSNLTIRTFQNQNRSEEKLYRQISMDKRFESNGICFSCGCDCYFDGDVLIVNDHVFYIIAGANYAMPAYKQGIYYLNENSKWIKITPKINIGENGANTMQRDIALGKLKIFNNGCSVAYPVGSDFYTLDICKS